MINNITITLHSMKHLDMMEKYDFVCGYYVGSSEFSLRHTFDFSLDDIRELKNTSSKKIFVNVNKLIHEDQLNNLETYLKSLSEIGVDYVVFADFAVYQINVELNLGLNLIYATETTITNSSFSEFAHSFDMSGIELAKEITLKEIENIAEHKTSLISINIHGHIYMYQSVRKLLANYSNYTQTTLDNSEYYLYDEEREKYYPIVENQQGTHILAANDLCLLTHLDKVTKLDIDFLKIDTFAYKDSDIITLLDIYQEAIHSIDNLDYSDIKGELFEQLKSKIKYKTFDTGFYFKRTVY